MRIRRRIYTIIYGGAGAGFAACSLPATPESEALVNKGSNELENKVLKQPAVSPGIEASQADDSIV